MNSIGTPIKMIYYWFLVMDWDSDAFVRFATSLGMDEIKQASRFLNKYRNKDVFAIRVREVSSRGTYNGR